MTHSDLAALHMDINMRTQAAVRRTLAAEACPDSHTANANGCNESLVALNVLLRCLLTKTHGKERLGAL